MMYLKERLNDHANILVDIRDELEIKEWVTRDLPAYQQEQQLHIFNELKINLPSMKSSEDRINQLINNKKE